MSEELEKEVPVVEEATAQETKPMSFEDGVIKVDLSELNKGFYLLKLVDNSNKTIGLSKIIRD